MKENKQTRTDRLFDQVKGEFIKALSTSPSFGIVSLTIHLMDDRVKRVIHKREESVIPESNNKGADDLLEGRTK